MFTDIFAKMKDYISQDENDRFNRLINDEITYIGEGVVEIPKQPIVPTDDVIEEHLLDEER